MAAINTMFSAVVGLPLFDTTYPSRVGAICMLYLSASDKQNVIDYVESRKCEAYLQEIANNLPFALEFSKRVSAFKIRSTEVTSQRSARTLLLWKALRGVVKTGWIREYHGPARAKKRGLKGAWHKYKKERDFVIRNLIRYRESRFPNPRLETRILVKFEEREELGDVEHDYVPRVAVHQVMRALVSRTLCDGRESAPHNNQ
jgi:hypothetical protein